MFEQQEKIIACPYCGEDIDVLIDCSAGNQEYFEDCSVCCAPILLVVTFDVTGVLSNIEPRRDDD